jgi:hypothetical protein
MSGDWLKIEKATCTKMEIASIAESLHIHPDEALGKCVRFWAWVDEHSTDGNLSRVTERYVDEHLIGCGGFCGALRLVGWLSITDGKLSIPNFDSYFTNSEKNRKANMERQKRFRIRKRVTGRNDDVTRYGGVTDGVTSRVTVALRNASTSSSVSSSNTPSNSPEENEEFEEKEEPQNRFDEFWKAYPRKVSKADAKKAWRKIAPDTALADKIIAAVKIQAKTEKWVKEPEFIPYPASWLNSERWEDEISNAPVQRTFDDKVAEMAALRERLSPCKAPNTTNGPLTTPPSSDSETRARP